MLDLRVCKGCDFDAIFSCHHSICIDIGELLAQLLRNISVNYTYFLFSTRVSAHLDHVAPCTMVRSDEDVISLPVTYDASEGTGELLLERKGLVVDVG